MRQLFYIALCLSGTLMWVSSPSAQEMTETLEQPIFFGTRDPDTVQLDESERLAIGWLNTPQTDQPSDCTASLITSRIVLTAKHCTDIFTADQLTFGLGVQPGDPLISFEVESKDEHPDFDVTLLYLREDAVDALAQLASSPGLTVKPLRYNRQSLRGLEKGALLERAVQAGGYGTTHDPALSGMFFATITIIDIDERFVVTDGRGIQGVCGGDSGGPLITQNLRGEPVIIATLTEGEDSCVGVDRFTRLDLVREWIDDGIRRDWQNYPEGGPCRELTFFGRCVENTVEWCDVDQVVKRFECPAGTHCIYTGPEEGYYCAETAFCSKSSRHCDTRFDSFLPDAPRKTSAVGICSQGAHRSQFDLIGLLALILTMLSVHGRRARSCSSQNS
ncbi:MAG: trypsin-like serine protease [Bradymonadia bacterium]